MKKSLLLVTLLFGVNLLAVAPSAIAFGDVNMSPFGSGGSPWSGGGMPWGGNQNGGGMPWGGGGSPWNGGMPWGGGFGPW